MTSSRFSRPLLATSLALSLLAACSPAPTVTPPAPTTAPESTDVRAATTPTPDVNNNSAVGGAAGIQGQPFAGADIKVFRLGQKDSVALGKTDETGHFIVDLGTTPVGVPLKVVATKGNQVLASIVAAGAGNIVAQGAGNIVAQGGGNIVAQGGGNIVAQGGGNIVAQGGGNIVAQGGGNIVAQGGGNIVAQGGGNRVLLEEVVNPPGLVRLNLATTTAVAILSTRLEAYGQVSKNGAEGSTEDMLNSLRGLTTELFNREADIVAKTGLEGLLTALDNFGVGSIPKQTGDALLAAADGLAAKIEDFVRSLDQTIAKTADTTGVKPDEDKVGDLLLGSTSLGTVEQHTSETNTNTTNTNQPNSSQSGSGSGPAGSNGATNPIANNAAAGVTVSGSFAPSEVDTSAATANVALGGTGYSAFFTSPVINVPRRNHCTAIVGNKVFVLGGYDASGNLTNTIYSASVDLNTGVVGTFTTLASTLPQVMAGASMMVNGQTIYLISGETTGNAVLAGYTQVDVNAAGTITGTSFNSVAAWKQAYAGSATDGTYLYLAGGKSDSSTAIATVRAIKISDRTEVAYPALGKALVSPAATCSTNSLVVSGGTFSGTPQDACYGFDTVSQTTVTTSHTLGTARYGHGMFTIGTDIYVIGGHGSSGTLSTAELDKTSGYDLSQPGLASAREGFTITPMTGTVAGSPTRLLILGGQSGGTVKSSGDITRLFTSI